MNVEAEYGFAAKIWLALYYNVILCADGGGGDYFLAAA
jgi:hypothetical protein